MGERSLQEGVASNVNVLRASLKKAAPQACKRAKRGFVLRWEAGGAQRAPRSAVLLLLPRLAHMHRVLNLCCFCIARRSNFKASLAAQNPHSPLLQPSCLERRQATSPQGLCHHVAVFLNARQR
jgi:hypothetical protein